MLENLPDLIKQHAGQAIINNPAIPNAQNDAAISAAGTSITESLKNMITSGNAQDLVNLFKQQGGNIANSPAAQQVTGNFVQTLMNKFGLDQNAGGVDLQNIIGQFTQGGGGDPEYDKRIIWQMTTGHSVKQEYLVISPGKPRDFICKNDISAACTGLNEFRGIP